MVYEQKKCLYMPPPPPPPPMFATLYDIPICVLNEIKNELRNYNAIIGFHRGYDNNVFEKYSGVQTLLYFSELYSFEGGIDLVDLAFVKEHKDKLEELYDAFLDKRSQDSFCAYIQSKISQDAKYLWPFFEKDQYFPKDILQLHKNEIFFDCGAYIGDSIAGFLDAVQGYYRRIYACEPDIINLSRLKKFISDNRLSNVDIIGKGLSNNIGKIHFLSDDITSRACGDSSAWIDVDTIDNITLNKTVTYIKMDIEGSEMEALQGAERAIVENKPILAISIYHKKRDLIDIPAYIRKLVPEYKLYFRTHKRIAVDAVLYATIR
jgi:FkbM family methyltransferase